ncbi:MAG: Nif3-like dinuclear metal center hexameric protein [Lachnospiraceae bacterium]
MQSKYCIDIMKTIESRYPVHMACEWDNVGLLAGRVDKEVKQIYIALDATDQVIEDAIYCKADMLITHHPLIFSSLRSVTNESFIGRRLLRLLQHDISYYAMHTNYDILGMADLAGGRMELSNQEVLEISEQDHGTEGIGRVGNLKHPITLQACCDFVKEQFSLQQVKVFGDLQQPVFKIAIAPGSGKSMVSSALDKSADVLITGDIDHHTGLDALAQGLAVIDAGHYGLEHIFIEDVRLFCTNQWDDIKIHTAPIVHPFQVV